MLRMLGAALAAFVFSVAGSASAATVFWSGVVGQSPEKNLLLHPLQTPGTYTFVSEAPLDEAWASFIPQMKYHLYSDGTEHRGYNYMQQTWDEVGKPRPVLTLTSTGFTFYVDPPQDRYRRTDLEVCNEWYGCWYEETWLYRTDVYMGLWFAAGHVGKAATIYFEPDAPSAVPEPATWLMLIAGFGITGAALRRPRRLAHA